MSSHLFFTLVIAVSAAVLTFGCQAPTVLMPGERGPPGMQGLPGTPSTIDLVLSNRSIFVVTTGRKKREIESSILLHFENVPPIKLESTANDLITKVVKIAEKDSTVKHRTDEVFFHPAEAILDGPNTDITFLFQREFTKNCKKFIDAVKKVNGEMSKFHTMSLLCDDEIF